MKMVRKTKGTKGQNVPFRLNNGYPFIELGGKRRQLNDPVYKALTGIVPGRVTDMRFNLAVSHVFTKSLSSRWLPFSVLFRLNFVQSLLEAVKKLVLR